MIPSATTMIPSANTMIPSATTMIPSANTMIPSATTMIPSANTMIPSATTMIPSANTMIPSATTMMSTRDLTTDISVEPITVIQSEVHVGEEHEGEERDGEGFMENEIPGEWEDGLDKNGVPLTCEIIRFGLSRIARTLDTFEFAYSRLDCRKQNIANIDALSKYIHLRLIDLGENKIKSCAPLAPIQNLLLLNVEGNMIESLSEIPEFPFLQALCLRRNKVTSSEGLFPNCLAHLQLGDNALEEVYGFTSDICPWLTVLELKGNKLKSIVGLDLPQLQRLYIAQNQLSDLTGLDGCPNLTHLHARENKISHLEGFPILERLEFVNLRGNNLRRYTQMVFLGNSPNIRTLILKGNPISTLENYKTEVLAANFNLRRLDKDPVLETELVDAKLLRTGRDSGQIPGVVDDLKLTANSTSVLDLEETQIQSSNDEEEEEEDWQPTEQ